MMSAQRLPYSPREVVDMSVFELDQNQLEYLKTPSLAAAEAGKSECSLSVCAADDSSSVSSVSLDESWEESSLQSQRAVERRSIFSSYWTKKGGRPKPLHEASCPVSEEELSAENCDNDSGVNSPAGNMYEKLLLKSEAARAAQKSTGRRRRIWSNVYTQSEPSLPLCIREKPSGIRKAKSSSLVEGTRRPSILRESRYSGSSSPPRARRTIEGTSVSFSEQVRVEYLKPETEKWAAKGWSEYFM